MPTQCPRHSRCNMPPTVVDPAAAAGGDQRGWRPVGLCLQHAEASGALLAPAPPGARLAAGRGAGRGGNHGSGSGGPAGAVWHLPAGGKGLNRLGNTGHSGGRTVNERFWDTSREFCADIAPAARLAPPPVATLPDTHIHTHIHAHIRYKCSCPRLGTRRMWCATAAPRANTTTWPQA